MKKKKEKSFYEKLVISFNKKMKIKINKDKCLGCGMCVSLAPEIFQLDEQGKSSLKANAQIEKNRDSIKQTAENCPASAIEIEE